METLKIIVLFCVTIALSIVVFMVSIKMMPPLKVRIVNYDLQERMKVTLRDILEELLKKQFTAFVSFPNEYAITFDEEIMNKAISQIQELIPKKHLVKGTPQEMVYWESRGYNQAIDDLQGRMK